ncbi:MAG TPA: hypothetical protein VGE98_06610 [Thermoanaerobaculia bacterium]
MTTGTRSFARRFRALALLRASLAAGALYDFAFAVVMVVAPELPARLLALPLPPLPRGRFYLLLFAILLTMLAALYLLAARDTRRYSGVVGVAILGRIAGGIAFFAAAAIGPDLRGLVPLGAADLAFGLVHAALWWPPRS